MWVGTMVEIVSAMGVVDEVRGRETNSSSSALWTPTGYGYEQAVIDPISNI